MKRKLKYYLAKFFVLLLAIRILDVSIDVDLSEAFHSTYIAGSYDDIDSFSELIFEKAFNNNDLFVENANDEHKQDSHRPSVQSVFYYVQIKNELKQPAILPASIARTYALRNAALLFEGHSASLEIPPDQLQIS